MLQNQSSPSDPIRPVGAVGTNRWVTPVQPTERLAPRRVQEDPERDRSGHHHHHPHGDAQGGDDAGQQPAWDGLAEPAAAAGAYDDHGRAAGPVAQERIAAPHVDRTA